MATLRVGLELRGDRGSINTTVDLLPWLTPEVIELDAERSLIVLATSFSEPDFAQAYARRRVIKSAAAAGVSVDVVSTEVYPAVVDVRECDIDDERQPDTRT